MAYSDDFGLEDDDTEFINAATLVETTQGGGFLVSPRPAKRRRLEHDETQSSETLDAASDEVANPIASDNEAEDDLEYYFPGELGSEDESARRNSKYKIHVPTIGGQYKDQIFTQTQVGLDSDPSAFRGAIWKKPQPLPPQPAFGPRATNGTGSTSNGGMAFSGPKQTALDGFSVAGTNLRADLYESDAALAARLQAEEDLRGASAQDAARPKTSFERQGSIDVSHELADLPSDAFSSSSPERPPDQEVILLSSQVAASQVQVRGLRGPQQGLKQMTIFGQPATQNLSASQAAQKRHAWPLKSRDEPPTHHKLDERAMETWVYPTNLGTVRDYQYNIVSRSLFHNTLVALPTGLGKTFIAATVMLNYYRWTKDAQIVFMAPTKPLIAQQLEACYHLVGIPRRDTVLMTGETAPALRAEEWLERRVFFMTPQTVINDLKTGIADPKKFVLIVVDEAHKATGGYAYTEVIKFVRRFNTSFRVLALTATPGSTVEAVQAVIENLGIARVELRTEQSLDIRQYTHEKQTETQLFDFSDEQSLIMDFISRAIRPIQEKLCTQNAYWSRDPMSISAFGLTQARQKWAASDAGRKAPMPVKGMINAIFTILAGLAHQISLLKFHGIGPFYSGCLEFQKTVDSGQTKAKNATQIVHSEDFTKMMRTIHGWRSNPDFIGHPKMEYLREVVLNHFLDAGEGAQGSDVPPSATRVMVFASFRDSTEEICRVLKRSEPMIRPHVFVGQAASKGSEGMDQKRQNAVIQDFKSGKYNTLVATSIGEEGLDIGTVDLIVCYDASSSPIRMLQRIGRTGRKRIGKVVLLLMRGKEENDYAKAQDNYAYIQKTIADPGKYNYRDDESPRILPKHVQPAVDKRIVDIPPDNTQPIDLNERGRRAKGKAKLKRPPKKFHMPDGVRTGFVKASRMDSDGDESAAEVVPKAKTAGKKNSASNTRKLRAMQLEPEPVQLPFLGDVLLNTRQQKELERKYAHTPDDEADIVIRAPDVTRFPSNNRSASVVRYMRHGRASRVFLQTMQAINTIDTAKVRRMKDILDLQDLQDAREGRLRLVNPDADERHSDAELPEDVLVLPSLKNPVKRPTTKKPSIKKTTTLDSAHNTDAEGANPAPASKKQRGRPKKKQPIHRTASLGDGAAEGDESSPEPTPANMRLGTQGIDLGSRDTSGEDDDEEPDSDLAEFIVRSDQPIELASSSQALPDDTQPLRPASVRRRGLQSAAVRSKDIAAISDLGSDESDAGFAALDQAGDSDDSAVEEVQPPSAKAQKQRKRRVVGDSDDEE